MKFLCIGMGAVGTYLGGRLLKAGHEVVFVVRKPKNDNTPSTLVIQEEDKLFRIENPRISHDLSTTLSVEPFDYCIVAVKSYDTDNIIRQLPNLKSRFPRLLCFQNGVDNEEKYAAILGGERVIYCTVTTAIGKNQPGNFVVERKRGLGIGDHPGGIELTQNLNAAGLNARLYKQPVAMKWSKLLTNLFANASSAILGLPPAVIFQNMHLYKLEVFQVREALAVMKALSLDVVNLPGMPVIPLVTIINKLPVSISRLCIARALGRGRGAKMPSLYIDLALGKEKSEVVVLNGIVARKGIELGLSTPVNCAFERILLSIAGNPSRQNAYLGNPERLVKSIEL